MPTRTFKLTIAISAMAIAFAAQAGGGPSGPEVTYPTQGHIGEVVVNPFKVAPLTAVVRDGGYKLSDVTVKVLPKMKGRTIEY